MRIPEADQRIGGGLELDLAARLGVQERERIGDDRIELRGLGIRLQRSHGQPRGVPEGVEHDVDLVDRDHGTLDDLRDALPVEFGLAQPPGGEVERPCHQRDRLADVVDRRRQELLAQALDAIRERVQPDGRGTVERIVDDGLARWLTAPM